MEGLAGVTQRIADIQGRFSVPAHASAASGTGPAFAAELTRAIRQEPVLPSGSPAVGVGSAAAAGGPPPELVRYGNGRIPPIALTSLGIGDHRLWAPAAQAFGALKAAAAADGVRIGVTDSYRSLPEQEDLVRRKGLYSQGGLAAAPGTSNHGWGLSLDLDLDGQAQAWMRTNAARFGFVEDVPREPWHWTFRPA